MVGRVSNEVLMERLEHLKEVAESGFEGINKRLDVLNGHVDNHEGRIQSLEDYQKNRKAFLSENRTKIGLLITIVTIAVAVLTWYVKSLLGK